MRKNNIMKWLCNAVLFLLVMGTVGFTVKAYAADGPVIKLHYHRADGKYDGWDVWLWEYGKDGAGYAFKDENGEKVATMEVTEGTTKVGFIVRTASWEKDVSEDQFIDISDIVSGTYHVYVESQVKGYTGEYGADCIRGLKLKTAVYKPEEKAVTVSMTADIEGDPAEAFKIYGRNGEEKIVKVSNIGGYRYYVELENELIQTANYKITFDGGEYKVLIPSIYSTDKFEAEYTYTGNDLGAVWTGEKTSFRVWAPTADSLKVKLYKSGNEDADDLTGSVEMKRDEKGTWVAQKEGDLNGVYYTYEVTINGEAKETIDPYARTAGVNGKRGMIIDLSSTNPEGWASDKNPHAGESITDAIIYEGHIRDLTADKSANIKNAGKFLGLTEKGTKTENGMSTGLDHMVELGITHLHILPMYDFGSVDETKGGYNWGYDPVNYNVPEGSYSTDAYNGATRVTELKQMVKTLHDNGISVVMDVVYNHVLSAADFSFNILVPNYFTRVDDNSFYSNGSGCGNDTATERSMVSKFIVDSVLYWTNEYHIDGFRFDLVGLIDVDTINKIVTAVHEVRPDVIFYGEGWSLTTITTKPDVKLCVQANSTLTPDFAYFNDTLRDAIKGSVFSATDTGFATGKPGFATMIQKCFMADVNWCKSPLQTINYASCHDNNTLFDRIYSSRRIASKEDRIAMNNLSAAIVLTSEGVPFLMSGEEMLRSKENPDGTLNENSYKAGDFVNALKYSDLEKEDYKAVFDYYKGLISFRKAHPALRLTTASEIAERVTTVEGEDSRCCGLMVKGGINGESADNIYIYFNGKEDPVLAELPEGKWSVCVDKHAAGTASLREVTGEVVVEPISAIVLVQNSSQAKGIGEKTSKALKYIIPGVISLGLIIVVARLYRSKRKSEGKLF